MLLKPRLLVARAELPPPALAPPKAPRAPADGDAPQLPNLLPLPAIRSALFVPWLGRAVFGRLEKVLLGVLIAEPAGVLMPAAFPRGVVIAPAAAFGVLTPAAAPWRPATAPAAPFGVCTRAAEP